MIKLVRWFGLVMLGVAAVAVTATALSPQAAAGDRMVAAAFGFPLLLALVAVGLAFTLQRRPVRVAATTLDGAPAIEVAYRGGWHLPGIILFGGLTVEWVLIAVVAIARGDLGTLVFWVPLAALCLLLTIEFIVVGRRRPGFTASDDRVEVRGWQTTARMPWSSLVRARVESIGFAVPRVRFLHQGIGVDVSRTRLPIPLEGRAEDRVVALPADYLGRDWAAVVDAVNLGIQDPRQWRSVVDQAIGG